VPHTKTGKNKRWRGDLKYSPKDPDITGKSGGKVRGLDLSTTWPRLAERQKAKGEKTYHKGRKTLTFYQGGKGLTLLGADVSGQKQTGGGKHLGRRGTLLVTGMGIGYGKGPERTCEKIKVRVKRDSVGQGGCPVKRKYDVLTPCRGAISLPKKKKKEGIMTGDIRKPFREGREALGRLKPERESPPFHLEPLKGVCQKGDLVQTGTRRAEQNENRNHSFWKSGHTGGPPGIP